jgi:hypothetical protein
MAALELVLVFLAPKFNTLAEVAEEIMLLLHLLPHLITAVWVLQAAVTEEATL